MKKLKVHKLIYKFFNIVGIFSLNFDGKKFNISNFRYLFSFIFIFGFLFIRISIFLKYLVERNHQYKITIFSQIFFEVSSCLNLLTTSTWIIILFFRQKKISKIFTIFKCFYNFGSLKVNLLELERKILIIFLFYNFMLTTFMIFYISSLLDEFGYENYHKMLTVIILDFPCIVFTTESSCFFNIILLHYEFLIKNVNIILEYQVELVHNDCRKLIENFYKIQKSFNLLNQTLGSIFSLITINHLVGVVAVVSSYSL